MSYEITWIPLAQLREAPWNANRVPDQTLKKIERSITTFGIVENLVVRPVQERLDGVLRVQDYEVISGNHRLRIYRELGIDPAPCYVTNVNDGRARILAEALNHVRGRNDPDAYQQLIRDALALTSEEEVLAHLNETQASLKKLLEGGTGDDHGLHWEGRYEVVAECADEDEQQKLYDELTRKGYTCRVLTL